MQQQITTIVSFDDLELFPSLNKTLREHFAVRAKRKEKLCWHVKYQTKNKHVGAVKVEMIFRAVRLRDWDNLVGGSFKGIGDALVSCGVIIDDNPKIVRELIPKQERVAHKNEERLIVKIEDII